MDFLTLVTLASDIAAGEPIIILLLMLREILKLSAIEHWARMRSSDNAHIRLEQHNA